MRTVKEMIILRGLPGSGKTWAANRLTNAYITASFSCVSCSADHFWELGSGEYRFDYTRIKEAHAYCVWEAERLLKGIVEVVIVDNVNYKVEHYEKYVSLANVHGYGLNVIMVGNTEDVELYHQRGLHGVALEVIERFAIQFEPAEGELLYSDSIVPVSFE